MKKFISKFDTILVFATLLTVFLINYLIQLQYQNNICIDCSNYIEAVFYLFSNNEAHYFRPIGMAIIYGFPLFFVNINNFNIAYFALGLNLFFYVSIILLFFQINQHFFTKKTAFYLSLFFLTFFGISLHIFQVLSEIPFVFFVLLAFLFLTKYYKTNSLIALYFGLSIFLFAILIRPGILFFSAFIILFHYKVIYKNFFSRFTLIFIIPFALLSFQLFKMKEKYDNYTISYIDAVTYYNYLGSKAQCLKNNTVLDQNNNKRANYIYSLSYNEQKTVAFTDFKNQLINNPKLLILAYIDDIEENTKTCTSAILIYKNIKKNKNFILYQKFFEETTEWQNKLTTLFGLLISMFYLYRFRKIEKIILIFTSYFCYIFFISGVSSTQGDRFHIVFYPIVIILLAYFFRNKKIIKKQPLQKA